MSRSPRNCAAIPASSAAGAHDAGDEAPPSAKSPASRLEWSSGRAPDLWFCYHPYSKAPDLIGPRSVAAVRAGLRHGRGLLFRPPQYRRLGRQPGACRRGGAAGRGQHLLAAEGPRRAAHHRAGRPLRDARAVHRRWRLSRHEAVAGFAPHRHGRHDAAGRQARKLPHAGPRAGKDRASPMDHRHRRRRPEPARGRWRSLRGSTPLAWNGWANGSRPRCRRSTAAARSMPGPVAAKPTGSPISKRRQPDCRWSRRISTACPASSATARPAC